MQRTSASLAVGLNCPVSMELIVFRDTPRQLGKLCLRESTLLASLSQ